MPPVGIPPKGASPKGAPPGHVPPVALVTGAGVRIGGALADDLASRGWAVAIHCHGSQDAADARCERLRAGGARACVVNADLAAPGAPEEILAKAASSLGPVGLLVNSAARFEPDSLAPDSPVRTTREGWQAHLDVNLLAPAFLTQALAAQIPRGTRGIVVNMLDESVFGTPEGFVSYAVSKAALAALTRIAARALAPTLRVNAIAPGPMLRHPRQSAHHFAAQASAALLPGMVTPAELCHAVRYLIGAEAVTGTIIALERGRRFVCN